MPQPGAARATCAGTRRAIVCRSCPSRDRINPQTCSCPHSWHCIVPHCTKQHLTRQPHHDGISGYIYIYFGYLVCISTRCIHSVHSLSAFTRCIHCLNHPLTRPRARYRCLTGTRSTWRESAGCHRPRWTIALGADSDLCPPTTRRGSRGTWSRQCDS